MRLLALMLSLVCRPLPAAELYFGLLHGHTSFSDGSGTPHDAFLMARNAGLDFMAITEHNHHQAAGSDGIFLTQALYGDLAQFANRHTVDGQFVAIFGQEVSTISSGNHFNIFYANDICDIPHGDFKALYEAWLPNHPEVPFIQFNHPDYRKDQRSSTPANQRNNDYGIDDYDSFEELVAASGKYVALIELIIGPAFSEATNKLHQQGRHEADYLFYLNKGYRLAPSVGQDNHNMTWGVATHARMGVWAESLTVAGLNQAILNRRCYASEDENLALQFTVNGQLMGSVIPAIGNPNSDVAHIHVAVDDPDEPNARYRVRLFYDDAVGGDEAEVIENVRLDAGVTEIDFVHTPDVGGYYFAKITQESDHNDDVWSAPVWIGATIAVAGPPVNTDDPQKEEINWDEASNYVGQTVAVNGRIVRSFNYRDRILFFNFHPDFENTLSLIVFSDEFDAFGGAAALQERLTNKQIQVHGTITLYQSERMQIRLTAPDQIRSVSD